MGVFRRFCGVLILILGILVFWGIVKTILGTLSFVIYKKCFD